MNLKTFGNGIALFLGLGLAAYSLFNKNNPQFTQSVEPPAAQQKFERWQVKSIYDGDTLRVQRNDEELKIRFCGTDSPRAPPKIRN